MKEFLGKFTSRYLLGHLLAMAVTVALLMAGVWYGLRFYTHHGEGIRVPDLKGMNSSEARRLLGQDGLLMEVSDSGYDKRLPADCVLEQLPAAGMTVKPGRAIFVTLNTLTSPRVSLPELIDNTSYRQARAKLEAMGFKVLEPKRIDGERDWVYGIQMGGRNLQNHDKVPRGSTLTLVIGQNNPDDEEDADMADSASLGVMGDEVDDFLEIPDMTEAEDD